MKRTTALEVATSLLERHVFTDILYYIDLVFYIF